MITEAQLLAAGFVQLPPIKNLGFDLGFIIFNKTLTDAQAVKQYQITASIRPSEPLEWRISAKFFRQNLWFQVTLPSHFRNFDLTIEQVETFFAEVYLSLRCLPDARFH